MPLALVGNFTPWLAAGFTTGLNIYDTSNVRNTMGIPEGVALWFTGPGPLGPSVDVNPFFEWPYLIMPGRGGSQMTNNGQYQVGVNLLVYLYL